MGAWPPAGHCTKPNEKRKPTMQANVSTRKQRRVFHWPLLAVLVATACAGGGTFSYTGQTANPESVIPLFAGDVRELKWRTNDLVIGATYVLENGRLDLAGRVQLQQRLTHFPVVDYLRIGVHALDDSGLILASYPLWSAGTGKEHFFVDWSFERHLGVPDDTQALTFSYRGRMRDGGRRGPWRDWDDGGGTTWDFWHTP